MDGAGFVRKNPGGFFSWDGELSSGIMNLKYLYRSRELSGCMSMGWGEKVEG